MVTNNQFSSSAGSAATMSVNMSRDKMGHLHLHQHQRNLNRLQHMNRLVDADESPFLMEGIKYPGKNGKC